MEVAGRKPVGMRQALVDFTELVARAVVGGVGVAVAMAVAILVLSAPAQAQSLVGINDPRTGTLLLRTPTPGRFETAPRVATEVAIDVHGMVARTRITQLFHNPAADSVEGLYVFPLPEKAAVDHLWMRVGDRLLEGQVKEKEEARRTYEQARSEGRKATLMEQQRPNLFTNAVAHIGPGETVEVKIEYQQSLDYDDGRYSVRVPLAITPRYDAGTAAPDGLQPAVLRMPAHQPKAGGDRTLVNPVDIVVMLDAGMPVTQVESSYHDVRVEKAAGGRATVTLTRDQEETDRDFELSWTVAASAPQAALFVQRTASAEYGLVMVVPPQPNAAERGEFARIPRETILVADTSGSMAGASMAQAKAALGQALGSLSERDRFNVIEFNSVARALFASPMPATAANRATALAWVQTLQARGGTEMVPALQLALGGAHAEGYLRQVVFMTDGAVSDEDTLFALIAKRLGNARLFTVGIGSAPNGHFMRKASQFGRGTFTQIGDVAEVQEKMTRLFAKIEAPVLRDVTIRWPDGTDVETFPSRVPDLYLGEPVLVSASATRPLATVIVSGMRGNQPWSVALTPAADDAAGVGALWARAKIASLMDEMARGGDAAMLRPAVVKVALDHHLVSAFTSLVAVDVTPTAVSAARTAMVKAALPHGSEALPQTDTAATLHLLAGLLALAGAAVAATGLRRAPVAA